MSETGSMDWVDEGGITTPRGYRAGASYAGIKTYGAEPRFDVGVLASDRPAMVAGVFTQNRVCGAPVTLTKGRVRAGIAQAVVANSGCSNVATGEPGLADARQMAELVARRWGFDTEGVLVASTGVIGRRLPMDRIATGIANIEISEQGGERFSRAILTTDTVIKRCALRVSAGGHEFTVAGTAKGAGMAHPNMATVLCFLTTDANVEAEFLQTTLREVADVSVNMIDVDMDTSTSDMMLLFANGAADTPSIDAQHPLSSVFQGALEKVCVELARALAKDGEGARTLITVQVAGAKTLEDARRVARTVASSPLVKTMVTGRDPNPGRILMAAGRSGAELDPASLSVSIQGTALFEGGAALMLDEAALSKAMDRAEVVLDVNLGVGGATATAWGCDLTCDYVRINADYTT